MTFSFLSDDEGENLDSLYEQIAWHFGIGRNAIDTILPCTPCQRDVLGCAVDDPRRAIGQVLCEIPRNVSLERLAAAWRDVVRRTTALHTCIFTSQAEGSFPAVLPNVFSWTYLTSYETKESVMQDEAGAAMNGTRCNRYAILRNRDEEQALLIWTFHHALVDKSLRERILQRVQTVYDG
ncbi:hypothetical protein GGR57DRAFT_501212 [Xylariaceae sp. FL1272]|nr:hypothetical protein GGR57DRAFT_501212 [Xylariaceae sp. FL1272]